MKVLHIVEAFGGGLFSFLVELINQSPEDFDITIAYSMRPQTPVNFKEYFKREVHFVEVQNFQRSVNPFRDLVAGFELRKITKEVKPDIIHLHSSKAGAIGRAFLSSRKRPVIYTPHGYSFLKKDDSKLKRMIYFGIEWIGGRTDALTIACSKGEGIEGKRVSKKVEYINNGINYKGLPNPMTWQDGKPIEIVMVGRICYQKNPKMFNEVALQFPQYTFRWVGEGELKDELTAPNIEIMGWCSREETLQYINQAYVFFLPSLWEGLPISLLEAMYLKKLCIVNDAVGNRDVIESGVNGYVIDSAQQCIEILNRLDVDREKHQQMMEKASMEIVSEYNVENMGGKYAERYRKLCAEYATR